MFNKVLSSIQDKDGFIYAGWQPKDKTIALYFLNESTPKSAVFEIPKGMYNNVVGTAQNSGFKATVMQTFKMLEANVDPATAELMFSNYFSLPAHLFNEQFVEDYADKLSRMIANCYAKGTTSLNDMRARITAVENITRTKQIEAKIK